jgi:hypothetical protein
VTGRIKTILASGDVAGLPEIARCLALDTDLSADAAQTVIDAAVKDIASVKAGSSAGQGANDDSHANGNRADADLGAHGLGAAEVIGGAGKEAARAAWGRAVADVNRGRFGDAVN